MMREAQFSRAIGDWSAPLPHQRMAVYRNNVTAALINALHVRFPVTGQLVGKPFFAAMARSFADQNRPSSPVLIAYGQAFPEFIRGFAPAAGVTYLADVAELENLWWQAYHSAEAVPLGTAAFAAVAAETWGEARFAFHPSVSLLSSSFAAASIWRAHRGGEPLPEIDVSAGENILVARPGAEVQIRVISAASFAFLAGLKAGESLAAAVEGVRGQHPDFGIATQLQNLLALGIITGLSI